MFVWMVRKMVFDANNFFPPFHFPIIRGNCANFVHRACRCVKTVRCLEYRYTERSFRFFELSIRYSKHNIREWTIWTWCDSAPRSFFWKKKMFFLTRFHRSWRFFLSSHSFLSTFMLGSIPISKDLQWILLPFWTTRTNIRSPMRIWRVGSSMSARCIEFRPIFHPIQRKRGNQDL